jgi:thioesterase domain-containing protein
LPDHAAFVRTLYDSYLNYVPEHYGGRVLVFVAKTQALLRLRQVEAAWRKIAPSSEVFEIGGTHGSIMEMPHGVPVAETLSDKIEEVIRRTDRLSASHDAAIR